MLKTNLITLAALATLGVLAVGCNVEAPADAERKEREYRQSVLGRYVVDERTGLCFLLNDGGDYTNSRMIAHVPCTQAVLAQVAK